MDKHDRDIVNAAKMLRFGEDDLRQGLILIIERLDTENKKLKADLDRAVNRIDTTHW